MVGALRSELQGSLNILGLKIGEIGQYLLRCDVGGEHFKNVRDADTYTANARLPAHFAAIASGGRGDWPTALNGK